MKTFLAMLFLIKATSAFALESSLTVALFGFVFQYDEDPSFIRELNDRFYQGLTRLERFSLLPNDEMKRLLKSKGVHLDRCRSDSCFVNSGKLLGVDQVIFGVIGRDRSTYDINIYVKESKTGDFKFDLKQSVEGDRKVLFEACANIIDKLDDHFTNATPAYVRLRSIPSGADVFVDENNMGKTPADLTLQGGHSYEIRVSLAGGGDYRTTLSLKENEVRDLDINLRKWGTTETLRSHDSSENVLGFGYVVINTNPTTARIEFAGYVFDESPVTVSNIAPGEYVLSVSSPKHRPYSETVEVIEGNNKFDIDLTVEQRRSAKYYVQPGYYLEGVLAGLGDDGYHHQGFGLSLGYFLGNGLDLYIHGSFGVGAFSEISDPAPDQAVRVSIGLTDLRIGLSDTVVFSLGQSIGYRSLSFGESDHRYFWLDLPLRLEGIFNKTLGFSCAFAPSSGFRLSGPGESFVFGYELFVGPTLRF